MSTLIFPEEGETGLLIIDVQERLLAAMPEAAAARLTKAHRALIEMARLFEIPVSYTEQYPKGLGSTVAPVRQELGGATCFEKTEFSACLNPDFADLAQLPADLIVTGMETHVCVLQTAADLIAQGHRVFVPLDAVASRTEDNWRNGLALIERVGGLVTNTETLVFRRLRRAGGDAFKRLSKLVK
jgi:nicotinamidase-related amidase